MTCPARNLIFLIKNGIFLDKTSRKYIFMPTAKIELSNIKPIFSGHETFPLRYGWLKKVYDSVSCDTKSGENARDIFNRDEAIAIFGVGKNMVASMRHWATWTGILNTEGKVSPYANMILGDNGLDPWLESPISLWILHWQLASKHRLLTYFWFFNLFNGTTFDREQMQKAMLSLCEDCSLKIPSAMTLKRDVDCFIRTYVSKPSKTGRISEDSLESPLAELNLITPVNRRDVFQSRRGTKSSLTEGVFLLVLWDFWNRNWHNQTTLSLEASVYDPYSPGRIFLMDEAAVLEKAYKLASLDIGIEWSESSGMRQFQRNAPLREIKKSAMRLIENEYAVM